MKQMAAMVGAVDAKNPMLMTVAAYILKNGVQGTRAVTNLLLVHTVIVKSHKSVKSSQVRMSVTVPVPGTRYPAHSPSVKCKRDTCVCLLAFDLRLSLKPD